MDKQQLKAIPSEEDVIREVAEEEGLTYDEVKEIWSTFKEEAENKIVSKGATKPKLDKNKMKKKKKQAKKSKRRNR
jgi:hypothetical protein